MCVSISSICRPIGMVGFRDVIGSWNTIAMDSPRRSASSFLPHVSTFVKPVPKRSKISPVTPAVSGRSPITESAVMLLPLPDSPTIPSRSPGRSVRFTFFTTVCSVPSARSKPTERLRTHNTASSGISAAFAEFVSGADAFAEVSAESAGAAAFAEAVPYPAAASFLLMRERRRAGLPVSPWLPE